MAQRCLQKILVHKIIQSLRKLFQRTSVSTSQLHLITLVEKPKDTWGALCNHFERGALANKLLILDDDNDNYMVSVYNL